MKKNSSPKLIKKIVVIALRLLGIIAIILAFYLLFIKTFRPLCADCGPDGCSPITFHGIEDRAIRNSSLLIFSFGLSSIFGSIYISKRKKWAGLLALIFFLSIFSPLFIFDSSTSSSTSTTVNIPTINPSTNLKTYENSLLNYEVGYPGNTSPFIPALDERTLFEEGKLSIDKVEAIQFRDNKNNSLFSVSSRDNPRKLSVEKFLEEECERIKTIPQEKGTKCPEGKYEYFETSDGKKILTEVIEWYASATKLNVVARRVYYPLDNKIIVINFSSIEQTDKDSLELQNNIIESFKTISY